MIGYRRVFRGIFPWLITLRYTTLSHHSVTENGAIFPQWHHTIWGHCRRKEGLPPTTNRQCEWLLIEKATSGLEFPHNIAHFILIERFSLLIYAYLQSVVNLGEF